jgi:hypothetical protein
MVMRVWMVAIFLACTLAGVGWLATRWNLEASQVRGDSSETGSEQYISSLEEISRLAKMANEQVVLTHQQIEQAEASILGLEQKLADSERFGAYWWDRAHPAEFGSFSELKAWLAEDDTDSTLYIYGSGCILEYDCDDYAVALSRNALADGYAVSMEIEGTHMLNSTIIGNNIYLIEPQTDEVWLWGYRD